MLFRVVMTRTVDVAVDVEASASGEIDHCDIDRHKLTSQLPIFSIPPGVSYDFNEACRR